MPTPIHVASDFQAHRRGRWARALPHRKSYLGFTLGLLATVIVALGALGWWLVQSGFLQIDLSM